MRTPLDSWFLQASYKLSDESAGQVWAEIQDHYQSAREAAIGSGMSEESAGLIALDAQGGPQAANRQYRKVLLTKADMKWLARWREDEQIRTKLRFRDFWIPKTIDSLYVPFLFTFLFRDANEQLWALGAMGVLAFVVRPMRWGARQMFKNRLARALILLAVCGVLLQLGHVKACAAVYALAAYVEYRDDSLRRKLPAAQWPRALRL